MFFSKLWQTLWDQLAGIAYWGWGSDPLDRMQLEYDRAVEELKEGRQGLEQQRNLVEQIARQVRMHKERVALLEAQIRQHLAAGKREQAAARALEFNRAKEQLVESEESLAVYEESYERNFKKIQQATSRLAEVKQRINQYDHELKLTKAEAELAKVAENLDVDRGDDFVRFEQALSEKLTALRAQLRASTELSDRSLTEMEALAAAEEQQADAALLQFELDMGLDSTEMNSHREGETGPRDRT